MATANMAEVLVKDGVNYVRRKGWSIRRQNGMQPEFNGMSKPKNLAKPSPITHSRNQQKNEYVKEDTHLGWSWNIMSNTWFINESIW